MVAAGIARSSAPMRRWNSTGRAAASALVVVVGGDERDGPAGAADAADDGAEHVGELGADDQEPLGVGFGRDDLQQRHQLAGARQPGLHEAVMAELDAVPGADAGGAQDLYGRPGPERAVFLGGDVAPFPGRRVAGPDAGRGGLGDGAEQGRTGNGDDVTGPVPRAACSSARARRAGGRRSGPARAGPGAARGCGRPSATCGAGDLALDGFRAADGAGRCPASPPAGVIDGPLG